MSESDARHTVKNAITRAGIDAERFVEVEEGAKKCLDHDTLHKTPPGPPENYGIYARPDDQLVLLDIDDYDDGADPSGIVALMELPATFEQESPHGGTHRLYKVKTTDDGRLPAAVLTDAFGVKNPNPSWGEVRVANQYVVGAGSVLDGCDKEGCDECAKEGRGRYRIQDATAITEIEPDEFVEALAADPDLEREDVDDEDGGGSPDLDDFADDTGGSDGIDVDDRLEHALDTDGRLRDLWEGDFGRYTNDEGGVDRSEAECALAAKLGWWFEGDKRLVRRLMNRADPPKWRERGDDYRDSVLEAVDQLDGYYSHEQGRWERPGHDADEAPIPWEDREDPEPPDPEELADADPGADSPAERAETSGGTDTAPADASTSSTAGPDAGPDTPGGSSAPDLTPGEVMARAGLDEDESLRDLAAPERALYAWQIVDEQPDVDIINVEPDNELFTCDNGVWVPEGENELRKHLQRALGPAYQSSVLNEAEEWVMGQPPYVRRTDMGAPEWTLPVENGLLDLEAVINGERGNGELRDLEPEDYALNRIGAEYDPDAEAPRFREYLDEVVRDEDVDRLQEYAGYMLMHWGQPYKKAMLLIGPTDSGKSTFTRIMRELLGGGENVASETLYDLISTRWGTAELFGTMANIRNELTSSELKLPERFKELTGGEEQISAEKKGEDKFEFVVTQKFLFSSNEVPSIEGADPAFYNRWLFASFPDTIPPEDQDPELLDDLKAELSGILNWALDGLERLVEQGEFSGERDLDEKQQMWEEHGSTIDRFKAECLELTGNKGDSVPKSDVYALYTAYADYLGKSAETQVKLTRELKSDSKIDDKEQDGTRYYTGIELAKTNIGGRRPLEEPDPKDTRDADDPAADDDQQRLG